MASVQLPLTQPFSGSGDRGMAYTTAIVHHEQQQQQPHDNDDDIEDNENDNIPYHARENARPFTYGNLPEGFKTSELNHVTFEKPSDEIKYTRTQVALPPSPGVLRKSTRPSISPSRPILKKTPSRQEFEEMLMERREQAMRDQSNTATKLSQNAAIQKDLDELQEILNKKAILPDQKDQDKPTDVENQIVPYQVQTADDDALVLSGKNDHSKSKPPLPISEVKRSPTPTFPLVPKTPTDSRCISPYPALPSSVTPPAQRSTAFADSPQANDPSTGSTYASSTILKPKPITNQPHEVEPHLVKFAKDCSEYWYKPHLTREEAVSLLRNSSPGTFIIRNSTTYKNSYGLVLRVAKPPPGISTSEKSNGDELVRHFLLEPTSLGVRLKGCTNEPVFTSLSALVYEHSVNQLALPCKLIIPQRDLLHTSGDSQLLEVQKKVFVQGAACKVLYLFTCDMESLTGDEAIRRAVHKLFAQQPLPKPVEVHFKVSLNGITITDNTRSLFFRRHYSAPNVSHFGFDPDNHHWILASDELGNQQTANKTIFGFVARPLTGGNDNQCHIFCDLSPSQPASAIGSFVHKVLPLDKKNHKML